MSDSNIKSAAGTAAGVGNARGIMGAKVQESAPKSPPHRLGRAVARVHRAEQHLAELIGRVAEGGQQRVDALGVHAHATDPKQVVVDPRAAGFPLDLMFAILVGEVCYNLRAALDYLVYELAKLDSNEMAKEGTQFPIVDDATKFPNARRRWLRGVSDHHVEMIENLQPYNGCSWTGSLRDLSNPDKHRTLTAVQAEHDLTVHVVDQEHLKDFEDLPGPIRPVTTAGGTEVFVKFRLMTGLQLADGSPVIEPLEAIKNKVAETLKEFQSEFV